MPIIKKLAAGTVAAALALGGVLVTSTAAQAHTPTISASCSGVVLKATAYDANKANVWEVTIGGATQTGTFGAAFSQTFPVPQEAATTSWSATIKAEDGTYAQTKSGTVGPCGRTTITLPTLGTTPASCDVAGGLAPDFTTWPAAQNPNGYEGDGYRIYIAPAYTGPGRYTATLQRVGPGFDPRYPNGTNVVGATSQILVVEPATGFQTADPSAPCFNRPPVPEIPEPTRTETVVDTADVVCGMTEVPTLTTWTETTYGWTWNEETKAYDPTSASSTGTVEGVRDLTDAERAKLEVDCAPVPPTEPPTTPEEPAEPPVTPEEPVTPPTTPEAPSEPQTPVQRVAQVDELAHTGADAFAPAGAALAFVLAGGLLLAVRRKAAR